MALFLVRYGEIGLKSPRVRARFERALMRNIARRFVAAGTECRLERDRGRIYLWSDDRGVAGRLLKTTFGVVSYSEALETGSGPDEIFASVKALAGRVLVRPGMSFRMTVRRTGQHAYTSMELAADLGARVLEEFSHLGLKVDLHDPDAEIFVEVRQGKAYVHTGAVKGPGGMPLGTQGRVLGIVNGERDIAACWLLMKRGCRVVVSTREPELAGPLLAWDPDLRIVGSGSMGDLARDNRAEGIVLGWGVDEYDSRHGELAGLGMPVFFPLIGMDEAGLDGLMKSIIRA